MTPQLPLVHTESIDKRNNLTMVCRRLTSTFGAKELSAPEVEHVSSPYRDAAINRLADWCVSDDGYLKSCLIEELKTYPDDLLGELLNVYSKGHEAVAPSVESAIRFHLRERKGVDSVREALFLYPGIADRYHYNDLIVWINSLRGYVQFADYEYLNSADPEVRSQCLALFSIHDAVAEILGNQGFQYDGAIANKGLVNLVIREYERVEYIAGIIRERRSDDPRMIQDVLNSDASALGGGVL